MPALCAGILLCKQLMMDFWQVLPVAVALVLILEGLMPFLSPVTWRNMVQQLGEASDDVLRYMGLAMMALGVVLLYVLNPQ